MSKVFQLNLRGLTELMRSPEMQAVLGKAAAGIRAAAGEGYEIEQPHPISFVAIASVRTDSFGARLDNSTNNTLLKAAGSVQL